MAGLRPGDKVIPLLAVGDLTHFHYLYYLLASGLERLTKPAIGLPHPCRRGRRRYAPPGGSRCCERFLVRSGDQDILALNLNIEGGNILARRALENLAGAEVKLAAM